MGGGQAGIIVRGNRDETCRHGEQGCQAGSSSQEKRAPAQTAGRGSLLGAPFFLGFSQLLGGLQLALALRLALQCLVLFLLDGGGEKVAFQLRSSVLHWPKPTHSFAPGAPRDTARPDPARALPIRAPHRSDDGAEASPRGPETAIRGAAAIHGSSASCATSAVSSFNVINLASASVFSTARNWMASSD